MDEKIEGNPRLLTCGYGVVFGRLEFVARKQVRTDGRKEGRVCVLWCVGVYVSSYGVVCVVDTHAT